MESSLIQYLSSPEFTEATSEWPRLVNKLKTALERNEFYETHQILRTIHFRLVTISDKVKPLTELLYRGSCLLLEKHEIVSGQDIGSLFIEASAIHLVNIVKEEQTKRSSELNNSFLSHHINNKTLDWDISQKVASIAVQLPDTEVGLKKFMADAFKTLKTHLLSRTILHEVLAKNFWQKKDYPNSRYNYLFCANLENAKDISQLLVEYHVGNANNYEVDLFLTQFIFQFLCIQNPLDGEPKAGTSTSNQSLLLTPNGIVRKSRTAIKNIAEKIFTSYILLHPQLTQESVPYTNFPLLNFTHFIISMLIPNSLPSETNESDTFTTLKDVYRNDWSLDPSYELYLTKIGNIYFAIPTQQRSGGFFDQIFTSLFDDQDNDQSEPSSQDVVDDLD